MGKHSEKAKRQVIWYCQYANLLILINTSDFDYVRCNLLNNPDG